NLSIHLMSVVSSGYPTQTCVMDLATPTVVRNTSNLGVWALINGFICFFILLTTWLVADSNFICNLTPSDAATGRNGFTLSDGAAQLLLAGDGGRQVGRMRPIPGVRPPRLKHALERQRRVRKLDARGRW